MSIEARLAELGIALPEPAAPVAAYVPVVIAGGLAHVSGQLPFVDGALVTGRLGEDVGLEQGTAAARACGLMILAQVKAALGSLDRVERVVKLGAFVNSTAELHRSAQGRQRRIGTDGRGVRRCRTPCAQRGRRARPAAGCGRRSGCDCCRQS